jgi:hypothetical protein
MRRFLPISAILWMAATAFAQVPRAADGHPDLSGIWQALGTANWDLEDHAPEPGPFFQLGATGGIPPGRGVVEGPKRSLSGSKTGLIAGRTVVLMANSFATSNRVIEMLSGTPCSGDMTLVERFRRSGLQTLENSVTVNDPCTYTAPWTASFPLTAEPGYQTFEYACHEGNYAMRNRLSAARAEEARDASAEK